MKLGLQLYTLRNALDENTEEALSRVADLGIEFVEVAGSYGHADKEFGQMLRRFGLTPVAAHVGFDLLEDASKSARYAEEIGVNRLVLPWVSAEEREDYAALSERLSAAADRLADQGISTSYHHHDFEYRERGIDTLIQGALEGGYEMELDTYWSAFGGSDPAGEIRRCAGRVPTLHLKDGRIGGDPSFEAVGHGDLDMKGILGAAKESGVEYGIIELDECPEDCFESALKSVEWLKSSL